MNHSQLKLVIVLAVFLGPLLASFVWYYGLDAALAPQSRTNHATLLTPPITVTAFTNPNINPKAGIGTQVNLPILKQKWNVIHVLTETCGPACQQSLYHSRQARLALGKDASRVQRVLISPNREVLTRLASLHPDSLCLLESQNGIEKQLQPILQNHRLGDHTALLVDPLGNVMMFIPSELDPRLLLKDLKHLLRVSRIG